MKTVYRFLLVSLYICHLQASRKKFQTIILDNVVSNKSDLDDDLATVDFYENKYSENWSLKVRRTTYMPLTSASSTNPPKVPNITIAILAPNTSTHLFRLRLAYIAVDYARNNNALAKELFANRCHLTIKQVDTDCDYTAAPINAYKLHRDVQILFGPICEYSLAPVARYSRYWNLAVLTPGGMSGPYGRDKTKADPEFPLLTRVGATFDGAAKCLYTVIKYFNWDNVVLLVDSDGGANVTPRLCHLAMSDVVFFFTQEAVHYKIYQFDEPENKRDYSQILTREIGLEHASTIFFEY